MTARGSARHGGLAAIAQRDVLKLLRDRPRLAVNLAFPVLLVAGLGSLLQPTVGRVTGLSAVALAFTGVLAATLFQSAAAGMISIVEDRETDFARVLFVTPVSRLTLIAGKVAGECLVALVQGGCVLAFAAAFGAATPAGRLPALAPACLACCLAGAAFGLVTVAVLPSQRSAMQVFQFLIIPQYLLGGVLVPLRGAAPWLGAVSAVMPLRYAVDLVRACYYSGTAGYREVVTSGPVLDAVVTGALIVVLGAAGTALFGYRERTR
ncbi:MAG TPA: ABC transporter permease [Streptosporangiaceae bacterium]|nr:ABC transporter permease [Streptosporangiaceae bacterium]